MRFRKHPRVGEIALEKGIDAGTMKITTGKVDIALSEDAVELRVDLPDFKGAEKETRKPLVEGQTRFPLAPEGEAILEIAPAPAALPSLWHALPERELVDRWRQHFE